MKCLYFAAHKPPLTEPILVLNGDGEGPINNLCVPSQVSRKYAPADQALISVTVLGAYADSDSLASDVRRAAGVLVRVSHRIVAPLANL